MLDCGREHSASQLAASGEVLGSELQHAVRAHPPDDERGDLLDVEAGVVQPGQGELDDEFLVRHIPSFPTSSSCHVLDETSTQPASRTACISSVVSAGFGRYAVVVCPPTVTARTTASMFRALVTGGSAASVGNVGLVRGAERADYDHAMTARGDGPIHLRVFVSSPGDVASERALARKVVEQLPYDPL